MKTLRPTLVLSDGTAYPVEKDSLKIGTMAGVCDIVLDDAAVSPIHCAIVKNDDGYAVQELRTDAGLAVDGVPVEKGSTTPITDGTVITIAAETLTFEEPKTLFTDGELSYLNDLAVQIGRGEAVTADTAEAALTLLQEKMTLIAAACGVTMDQHKQDNVDTSDEATPSDAQTADVKSEAPENKTAAEPEEAAESEFSERQKPGDQIDETRVFKMKVDDSALPTICFMTPLPETTRQFRERAICVKVLPYTIGADPHNDYVMADTFRISPEHAEIVENPDGGFELKNKDSRYGTYINGQLIRPEQAVPFKAGDVITFGTHQYRVEEV